MGELRDDQCLRIILGIESADDHIRNGLLQKGMSVAGIQRAFNHVARAGDQVGRHRVGIDVNILAGGPGTTPQTAAFNAAETARFALAQGKGRSVDFNIHPYYPSARGVSRFPTHPRCSTSILVDAIQAVAGVCQFCDPPSRIFVCVQDEGHDTDRSGRLDDSLHIGRLVERFNATQDVREMAGYRT